MWPGCRQVSVWRPAESKAKQELLIIETNHPILMWSYFHSYCRSVSAPYGPSELGVGGWHMMEFCRLVITLWSIFGLSALPRGVSVFAHTSPIYFLQDVKKVREQASIEYLCKYVQGVLHWLDTKPPFANEEDRQSARRTAEDALRIYKAL
jgi:hypothetical protein